MSDKPVIVDGIKVNITRDDIDDVEFAELMEAGSITTAMRKVFGEDDYQKIKEALSENGKCKLSTLSDWFTKVATKLGAEAKN